LTEVLQLLIKVGEIAYAKQPQIAPLAITFLAVHKGDNQKHAVLRSGQAFFYAFFVDGLRNMQILHNQYFTSTVGLVIV